MATAEYHRQWYAKNKEKVIARARQRRKDNPEAVKRTYIRHRFGGPQGLARYEKLLADQNGNCAICERHMDQPCFDHDRSCCSDYKSCGKCLRALLCRACNSGIGHFQDKPEVLRNAVTYIEFWNKARESTSSE